MSAPLSAKVKSVLSGDTVILSALHNPKAERTLSLAFVSAPRLKREGDEPFAFESRDFIRRLLVGKVIQFRVLYTLPTGAKREYGTIVLQDGQSLPELSVAEGYLKLRDDAGKREESELSTALIERLKVLESRAKADEKGMWDPAAARINTSYEAPNAQEFAKSFAGKPLEAIVEKGLTGDRLIVRLMHSPTQHTQTMLLIAGIRAPNTARTNQDGQTTPADPFGDEAHEFVESRLLQRRVTVNLLGASPQNQLIASVKHPNGDIAVFLLKAGLARCTDFHTTMLGQDMSLLRKAEQFARESRVGLWQGAAAPRANGGSQTEVVVSRVQSADTLFLRYPNGSEKRVNLSSVRQPKPSDPAQAPYGAEAKEFLRKRLIGKHVKVSIDGKRPATEGFDEREMATVTSNGNNIALDLVEAGYVSVIRHRMDDNDRSSIYDELLLAEEAAQKARVGMWSAKAPEAKAYVDYSENLEKAKRLLSLLSRQKRVPAVVDFVKSGSRFTLLIPRENAKLTLVLSGIQAPKSARNATEAGEPFGKEAHELANKRCQQRDVEIDVEDNDKVGGFIGKLYVNGENFAKTLLENGYASVRGYSAEKSGNATELFAAEQAAKDARKGLWHDYDPSQDASEQQNGDGDHGYTNGSNGDAAGAVASAAPSRDYRDVVITHVEESCRLKMQQISPSTTGALSTLMTAFRSFHLSTPTSLAGPPKAGDFVAAKFTEDGEWYRARIRRNDRENKTSEIVYVDYGNSETLPWSALRPIGDKFGIQALKTQAVEATLSFVQFPSGNQDYMQDAREWLQDRLVNDKQLVARIDHTDQRDGTLWVSLFDPENGDSNESINSEVIEDGLAMVGRKLSRWEQAQRGVLEGFKVKEQAAKDARTGMWQYGDLTED